MNKRILRRNLPRHWNRIAFTRAMLEGFAALENITIIEDRLKEKKGYYYPLGGRRFIALDDRLRGLNRDFALAHELAHHWCHHVGAIHCLEGFDRKAEAEADLIAACCVIPRPLLLAHRSVEIIQAMPPKIVRIRLQGFIRWGI